MKQHATIPYSAKVSRGEISEPVNFDNGWLVTLSDLTLLLLCFLVVWYVKNQEQKATSSSTTATVQAVSGGAAEENAGAQDADWRAIRQDIEKFVTAAGLAGDITVAAANNEIMISFKDAVPFASGNADLRSRALPVLEKVAAVAVARPALEVWISGHTDDRAIATAAFPSNWELSSARASRVARYLIEKGVQPGRIAVHGFADHRPRVANNTGVNRGSNRRVELRLVRSSETIGTMTADAP
jgi:chemotaxis protein MotB